MKVNNAAGRPAEKFTPFNQFRSLLAAAVSLYFKMKFAAGVSAISFQFKIKVHLLLRHVIHLIHKSTINSFHQFIIYLFHEITFNILL